MRLLTTMKRQYLRMAYPNKRYVGLSRKRRRKFRAPRRAFVPRTMGPFSATESKYFDSVVSGFAIPGNTVWSATNDCLKGVIALPQEGSDINNRVGRKISIYKIALRGVCEATVQQDQADILGTPAVRVIFWQDMQTNATVTNSSLLMEAPGAGTASLNFSVFQNTANFGRFRVLKDFILRARDSTAGTDGASTTSQNFADRPFKITHKFKKPVIVRFNAVNGGSIGDIVDNSFYLSVQSSNADGTSNISVQARCYYKDH